MWPPNLHYPWNQFLAELDALLSERIELHCIGGFAAVAAYHLPRSTNDLDYYTLVPAYCRHELERLAGEGSTLARKYRVHVHRAAVASLPMNYDERLTELLGGHFRKIGLFVLDPYDLILSKLSRNADRDREDVKHLAQDQKLDSSILRGRYAELRPALVGPAEQHDKTLEFWLEAYFQQ
jgi:hypothetical protein